MARTRTPQTEGGSILKRLLLGRPLASEEAGHQLLPKVLALPIFASDALSSVAYATEEIMHALIVAGTMHLGKSLPISFAVSMLMIIVITSYRQTVRAYPRGGGSYIVTKDNIGQLPGLFAGSALLIDYILTVAVSIAAGAFAVASLIPELLEHRVMLAMIFLTVITLMNLRGARESGSLFAAPTYAFIATVLVMLVVGITRCTIGECPQSHVRHEEAGQALQTFTLFLLLKGFSSGATALTGVEAIADGVAAFRGRRPSEQAANAAQTLAALGTISITMFLGITFLANRMHVQPSTERSVLAQIGDLAFGGGIGFGVLQVTTALILILAANTAYQDFPRLSSVLARDRFMPRQFVNRGDRLVFSNGIIVLALVAALLIWLYDAEVTRLIQLYLVGVFTSFTLSQAGMVMRGRRLRDEGWKGRAILNGIGATTTGVVLVVVAVTKFVDGAWIVITAIPLVVLLMRGVHKHYARTSDELRVAGDRPAEAILSHVVVPVARLDESTVRAIGYAKGIRPLSIRAVHVAKSGDADAAALEETWSQWSMGFPLERIDADDPVAGVRAFVRGIERGPGEIVTVLIPERLRGQGWRQFLRSRRALLLKGAMLFERGVAVTDVPMTETLHRRPVLRPPVPSRNEAVVLVSSVHNASLRAVAYAVGLRPSDVRAVTFAIDEEDTEQIMESWSRQPFDVPLEILDSPYREVRKPLVRFVRELRDAAPDTVVTVVLPEFVVRRWWHQFLHNQTALAIKARLLFERDVVVTSVPFHLS